MWNDVGNDENEAAVMWWAHGLGDDVFHETRGMILRWRHSRLKSAAVGNCVLEFLLDSGFQYPLLGCSEWAVGAHKRKHRAIVSPECEN